MAHTNSDFMFGTLPCPWSSTQIKVYLFGCIAPVMILTIVKFDYHRQDLFSATAIFNVNIGNLKQTKSVLVSCLYPCQASTAPKMSCFACAERGIIESSNGKGWLDKRKRDHLLTSRDFILFQTYLTSPSV